LGGLSAFDSVMDPSLLCEVMFDDNGGSGAAPLDNLTEDDIVLLDGDYDEDESGATVLGSKRPFKGKGSSTPPVKKIRRLPPPKAAQMMNSRNPHSPGTTLSPAAVARNLLRNKQLSVTSRPQQGGVQRLSPQKQGGGQQRPSPQGGQRPPQPLKQSITWKYRQLAENQYTADIRKVDLLKNYEPEQCSCKVPKDEDDEACGSGCINRSTYNECDSDVCKNGTSCTNMAIQRRQYAPGLERFMTAKKGWGVRARQSISKGSFILEYTGEVCSSKVFEQRMLSRYTTDNHHYCLAIDNKTMIDAHRAGSECRFVNHACEPNCEMEKWTVGGLSRMALFSLRDILPGEEICYDYNFSLFNTDQGQECKCGAKTCRGVIGGRGKDYLITIEDAELTVKAKAKSKPSNQEASSQATNKGKPAKQAAAPASPATLDPSSVTAIDAAWFQRLPPTELEAIEAMAPRSDQLSTICLKCTVCNEQLNHQNRGDLHRHPELGVLMCTKCYKSYGRGGWTKDGEGNDEYCRWCSEGGQIYLCDYCPQAFCNKCLRWNLGRKYLKKLEDEDKWSCLNCDASPLREQRAHFWAITRFHKEKLSAKLGKAPPANPSSPATPKKSSKVGGAGVVSNGLPHLNGKSPSAAAAILGKGSNAVAGGKMSPSAQKMSTIASTVASLQANQAISVGPAASPHSPKVNGVHKVASPQKSHFLDASFKEAEETLARLLEEAKALKTKWSTVGRSASDVAMATKQLRTVLEKGKTSLNEVDRKVERTYRARVKGADMDEILPEGRKSPAKEDSPSLKTEGAETAATPVKQKSEPKSPVKAVVKTVKKEAKVTPKKEEPVEVEVKYEEEEEEEKPKSVEASDHLVIFATEGEAVIKDVEKLGENIPSKPEKEEERIQDVSVDELEVEDSIMEQVNGDASEVGEERKMKSNGVEPDLMESKCADKVVPKESKPYSDGADDDESLKKETRKESESDSLNCIQEKES